MMGGMQKLLYFYAEDAAFVKDLARICTDYIFEAIDRAIGLGADAIALVSDLAHNYSTMMSPAHYEEFLLPYHKEITDFVHKRGLKVLKHSDGKLWRIMDRMAEAGFDGMHPIQPQCMDIAEAKAKYGKRFCLLGNIDCEILLPFGSEEEVEQAVKETIAAAAPGGGYIISSSNTIHPGCKSGELCCAGQGSQEIWQIPAARLKHSRREKLLILELEAFFPDELYAGVHGVGIVEKSPVGYDLLKRCIDAEGGAVRPV